MNGNRMMPPDPKKTARWIWRFCRLLAIIYLIPYWFFYFLFRPRFAWRTARQIWRNWRGRK